jgi:hypothetical protein
MWFDWFIDIGEHSGMRSRPIEFDFFTAVLLAILILTGRLVASEIREFDIPTLEKLGNELSHRDKIAAKASDLVFDQHPDFRDVSPQGWITDLHKDGDIVYWLREAKDGVAPAYKVTFSGASPTVEDIHNAKLPAEIALRYKARQTALRALRDKLNDIYINDAYEAHYNFEVLDDPDGSRFLVYALAAFERDYPVYVGGDIRVTVSADGRKVERIDQLSHGIIEQKSDDGAKMVSIATAQAVKTPHPVETWIYSSNLYHLPMYVRTTDGASWGIAKGRIVRVDVKGPKNHLDILNGKAPEVPQP